MPELPEIQALAERLDDALAGSMLCDAQVLGFSSLKTVSPAPDECRGRILSSVTRRGKYVVLRFEGDLRIVLHLSQAGRVDLEVPPKATKPRGSVARLGFGGSSNGRALLVREFGTQRKAAWWVIGEDDLGPLAGLGPEAGSPEFAGIVRASTSSRRLHTELRDQRVVSGIGRGWGDDIVHRARLSPFATMGSLDAGARERLIEATATVLEEALERERERTGGLSQSSLAGRFAVHGRAGEPCPTPCDDTLRRVSFDSHEMTYCPTCQTGGRVLADRRLSRLIK